MSGTAEKSSGRWALVCSVKVRVTFYCPECVFIRACNNVYWIGAHTVLMHFCVNLISVHVCL